MRLCAESHLPAYSKQFCPGLQIYERFGEVKRLALKGDASTRRLIDFDEFVAADDSDQILLQRFADIRCQRREVERGRVPFAHNHNAKAIDARV